MLDLTQMNVGKVILMDIIYFILWDHELKSQKQIELMDYTPEQSTDYLDRHHG